MNVTVDGTENYVIGVDYGTLSGRAVVVRVRDGKELGSGVFEYPHAVVTGALPADVAGDGAASGFPGEWALQVPNDYRDVLRQRRARGDRRRRDRPGRGRRDRHGLHRLHHGAGAGRRHPAERAAGLRRPPARLRQALAAPRRAGPGRPHQRAGRRAGRDAGCRATAG